MPKIYYKIKCTLKENINTFIKLACQSNISKKVHRK